MNSSIPVFLRFKILFILLLVFIVPTYSQKLKNNVISQEISVDCLTRFETPVSIKISLGIYYYHPDKNKSATKENEEIYINKIGQIVKSIIQQCSLEDISSQKRINIEFKIKDAISLYLNKNSIHLINLAIVNIIIPPETEYLIQKQLIKEQLIQKVIYNLEKELTRLNYQKELLLKDETDNELFIEDIDKEIEAVKQKSENANEIINMILREWNDTTNFINLEKQNINK